MRRRVDTLGRVRTHARLRWLAALAAVCLAGCGPGPAVADPETARATLRDREGREIGGAVLEQTPHGVLVRVTLEAAPPGTHALHLHETGVCEAPFTSAGGHFAPAGRAHGFRASGGHHAGDLPNVWVPASGRLELEVLAPRVRIDDGAEVLLDGDGGAVVIHEGADDYRTDPAGAAGARIACGVIRADS